MTEAQKQQFLSELEATGNSAKAIKASGAPKKNIYDLRVKDPDFDRAWEMALIKYFGSANPDEKARSRPRRGRPGTYDPLSHPGSARKLKAMGLSDEHLAVAFGIAGSVLFGWKSKYPEFAQAVKDGLDDLGEKTALRSLYALMNGYEHPEEKIFYNAALDKTVTVQTTKHYPPNITAIIFWLCNKSKAEFQSINNQKVELNTDGLKALADVLKAGPVPRAKKGAEE